MKSDWWGFFGHKKASLGEKKNKQQTQTRTKPPTQKPENQPKKPQTPPEPK